MPEAPRTNRDILFGAAKALGKIELLGLDGPTLITRADVELLALACLVLGLRPIEPHSIRPPRRLIHKRTYP